MKNVIRISKEQARRFMLRKHGLIGDYKFSDKQGVLDFVSQAGCIQYDPIDICGKNAELVLQSRVKCFKKSDLYALLYEDRALIDYFDKNLAIFKTADWPYFLRTRKKFKEGGRSHTSINAVSNEIINIIREHGPCSSADIGYNEKVDWYWSSTKLSRAALESMYFAGALAIHHKKGTIKHYDLAEKCIPKQILNAPEPLPDEMEYLKWRILRRIGAVGLLWNKASDAFLMIGGLNSSKRNEAYKGLLEEGKIIQVEVDDIKEMLYCLSSDLELLENVTDNPKQNPAVSDFNNRCELIAPLDNLMWDRKLIKTLFDFEYKFEIYTPEPQRKFGYYVLPIIYGDRFIGRIEPVCNRKTKTMTIKNIWYEKGVKQSKRMQSDLNDCIGRFADFNQCKVDSAQEHHNE